MTAETILVTEPEHAKATEIFAGVSDYTVLAAPTEEAALATKVLQHGARAVIVGIERYQGTLYEALGRTGAGRGAILSRFGVGHDSINKVLASQHGILVANTRACLMPAWPSTPSGCWDARRGTSCKRAAYAKG